MRRLGAVVAAAAVLVVLASPASAAPGDRAEPTSVTYQPPVDAPLLERFRPPPTKYGAGNRGIDYDSPPGTVVNAAADGQVVFAGRIGPTSHVTVLHADGIRTSYSFLSQVVVRRGDHVRAGQPLGATGAALHFGARAGEEYIDPLLLLGGDKADVRLIPDDYGRALPEHVERSALERALRGVHRRVIRPAAAVVERMRERVAGEVNSRLDELMLAAHFVHDAAAMPSELLEATLRWRDQQGRCTAQERGPPPAAPTRRRIAVLVAGLGSSSDDAAVFEVDTEHLGYRPADVHRYSYRGAGKPYVPHDTTQDIVVSAGLLREQVGEIHRRHPDAIIDVIAHSQGGLVARRAAVDGMPGVGTVVTLGTPHHGADLATAAALVAHSETGKVLLRIGGVTVAGIDPASTSIAQMGEHSSFVRELNSRRLPDTITFRSVAARGDWVVPSHRSRAPGGAATNAVVEVAGLTTDHDHLPGSPQATREIALALAGLPPTCRSFGDHALDVITATTLAGAEDLVGLALGYGAHRVDGLRPATGPGLG